MKALVIEKPGSAVVRDLPMPKVEGEKDVIIKVGACGLCGTDIHAYHGLDLVRYPLIPGHEFYGEVIDAGREAGRVFKEGDVVIVDPNLPCGYCRYCREGMPHLCENMVSTGINRDGAYGEFVRVDMRQCYKLEKKIRPEAAILGEPLSCVIHGVDRAGITSRDDVVIFGGGPIGMLIYKYLKIMGIPNVALLEPKETRRRLAVSVGIRNVYHPRETEALGRVSVVIEASGSPEAFRQGLELLDRGGRFLQFGVADEGAVVKIHPYEIYKGELSIMGSFVNPNTMSYAIKILTSYEDLFAELVTKRVDLDGAYALLTGREDITKHIKVMIVPS